MTEKGFYVKCARCKEFVDEFKQEWFEDEENGGIYCADCWEIIQDDSGDSPNYKQD